MNLFKRLTAPFLLATFILTSTSANPAENAAKVSKLEPITVNLLGTTQHYIQVEMSLKLANPEVNDKIKLYMPVIRHKIILLLTSKDAGQLGSTEGKLALLKESKVAINHALEIADKEGVTDVLFESFIIQ